MREIKFRTYFKPDNMYVEAFIEYTSEKLLEDKGIVFEQYTGLNDKNDKEIYEHDIVIGDSRQGIVVHVDGRLTVVYDLDSGDEWEFQNPLMRIDEVIGNIHENPELENDDEIHKTT